MARRTHRVLLMLGLLAGGAALAGELAREGPVDSSLCFGGPMHVIAANATDRFGSYVVKGGTSASDMAFDSMTVECTGTFETRTGKTRSNGYCIFRDASGDTIQGTDGVGADGSYAWTYFGGTGKFQGITGSGKVERWGSLSPVEGAMRGCRRFVGTYKFR